MVAPPVVDPVAAADPAALPPEPPGSHARPGFRPRSAPLAYAILVAAALACGDNPVALSESIDVPEARVTAVTDALSDASARIAAQLDAASGGATVRTRLDELEARIQARDLDGTTSALERARAALDVAEGAGPTEQGPDRAAIRLALDDVQRLLDEN